jgi:hypothetical protein
VTSTPLPTPDPAALSAAVGAVTDTTTPADTSTPPDRCYAVIQSIQLGPPRSLTVQVSGSAVDIPSVKFNAAYSPRVGDTVVCDRVQGDLVVAYSLSGGTGATGGPVPLGAMIALDYALTDVAWLLCIGGTFSAATYPDLYAARGNNNVLPDMRGVTLMGAGANGVVLGTRDASGQSEAHVHGSGGGHTHTGPSHTHTGPSHTHSHSHGPGAGSQFFYNGATWGSVAGTGFGVTASTDTDATAGGTGATGSSGTGATGNTDPGNTASYGSGTANMPPNYGANVYMRAL